MYENDESSKAQDFRSLSL